MVEFTDEEGYGKYLDLHECHEKYINLKGVEVSYCYLLRFSYDLKYKMIFNFSESRLHYLLIYS